MSKGMIYLAISVGGFIGSYLPVILFHVGSFSAVSIISGVVGSVAAVIAVYKYLS